MSSEHTPLLTTVRLGHPRRRYPHNVLRRFCTIALASTLIWFLLAIFVTLIFNPEDAHYQPPKHRHRPDGWTWPGCPGRKVSDEQLKQILLDTPDSKKAEEWSHYYATGAHIAGQNYSQVVWTKDKWEEFGIKAEIKPYEVYLNRPVSNRLALLHKTEEKKGATGWRVAYEAALEEDVLEDDPTTGAEDSIPIFHGYSASGNVTAPLVYVNYGTYQDYDDLLKANVSLKGKIAIARYGGIFRGLKVKRAQELGMVGTILYTDPGDDGPITEANGYKQYPEGPARQASSVQRGSAEFLSIMPGDPTTPGYPSLPGVPRAPTESVIPSIPSVPISYKDALPLLKALNGHGPRAKDMNKYWTRSAGLGYLGVEYNIGPTPDDVVVNLVNEQDYITTPIWNVIGVINGTIPDEVIVVGNHRDAWIVGGAGDPNSGSAVLNEAIRSLGAAVAAGWKPLRTIVFGSWDGEEYGLVGSTEWVEEYLPWLSKASVAYINVDGGASGTYFHAASAPILTKLLTEVLATVPSANQTVPGQTVADLWDGRVGTIGSGSDFTAFQDYAGVPSLDMGFSHGEGDAVYHYHSNYDSFWWMQNYGDVGYKYHRVMAQVLNLVVARLADSPVVPFKAADYADALGGYVKKVQDALEHGDDDPDVGHGSASDEAVAVFRSRTSDSSISATKTFASAKESFDRLYAAVWKLKKAAIALDERAAELERRVRDEKIPWWKWPKRIRLGLRIRRVNTRYKFVERSFLHPDGLDGRNWFKHVVFAPGLWTGYAGAVFPGLMEAIDDRDEERFRKWIDITENALLNAAKSLE